jgi:hypothetical protein
MTKPMPAREGDPRDADGSANDDDTDEEEDADPVAFLLAGVTRTALFVIKRVGLSPEVLRSFVQRKAFMRVANVHAAPNGLPPPSGSTSTSTSTGRFNASFIARTYQMKQAFGFLLGGLVMGQQDRHVSLVPLLLFFVGAETIKSSVMGLAVFGVYELSLARVGRAVAADGDDRHDVEEGDSNDEAHAPGPVVPMHSVEEERDESSTSLSRGIVVGHLHAPAVHAGDHAPIVGHVGAGATAGIVQSVLMDAYELVVYWWTHRHQKWSGVNVGLVARRAVRDAVGFAALFGAYEAARRYLEDDLYGYVLRSGSSLARLERYRVVTRDDGVGAYDASAVSMGAAFVAGGVAGQGHLVVNHYTHHLFVHQPASRRRHGASSVPTIWSGLPKPPKARMVAGAFLPSALCFLAFRYGGVLAERLLADGEDAMESGAYEPRHGPAIKLLPIYLATAESAKGRDR